MIGHDFYLGIFWRKTTRYCYSSVVGTEQKQTFCNISNTIDDICLTVNHTSPTFNDGEKGGF